MTISGQHILNRRPGELLCQFKNDVKIQSVPLMSQWVIGHRLNESRTKFQRIYSNMLYP